MRNQDTINVGPHPHRAEKRQQRPKPAAQSRSLSHGSNGMPILPTFFSHHAKLRPVSSRKALPLSSRKTLPLLPKNSGFVSGYRFSDTASPLDRKSTRLNSSHLVISYAVFCLK